MKISVDAEILAQVLIADRELRDRGVKCGRLTMAAVELLCHEEMRTFVTVRAMGDLHKMPVIED
jgi:hypothetical protein